MYYADSWLNMFKLYFLKNDALNGQILSYTLYLFSYFE